MDDLVDGMRGMNPSTAFATVIVDELVACGVTDAVMCPGSRNAPLSIALYAAAVAGRLRLHVRIDERGAGFLAVGLARRSGRPVAVATTSGTAVANLHPAVLEAHHGGVPLVVLSADRPPRLRDVGANQTVDQQPMFGSALRYRHEFGVPQRQAGQNAGWRAVTSRAVALAAGAGTGWPGPVQLNLPLDDPLVPGDADGGVGAVNAIGAGGAGGAGDAAGPADWPEPLTGRGAPWTGVLSAQGGQATAESPTLAIPAPADQERCLFVADLGHPLAEVVAAAGYPVVAESGGAAGAHVLAAGVHLLGDPGFLATHRPDRVIVLGRPTLFRGVGALLADSRVHVDVVAPVAGYADASGVARRVGARLAPLAPAVESPWLRAWRDAAAAASAAVDALLDRQDLSCSLHLGRELVRALPEQATLVLGSSQPPRDVALASVPRGGIRVVANRGVAGIDGLVSTAAGVALAGTEPTVAFLGDLSLVHDATGLVIGAGEPRPDLAIVVSHNDGGAIFATLEPGGLPDASMFERVFAVGHGVSFEQLAAGTGAEYVRAGTAAELGAAIRSVQGVRIVEVRTDRHRLRGLLHDLRAGVAAALS